MTNMISTGVSMIHLHYLTLSLRNINGFVYKTLFPFDKNPWFLSNTVAKLTQNTSDNSSSLPTNDLQNFFNITTESIKDKITSQHSSQNDGYELTVTRTNSFTV